MGLLCDKKKLEYDKWNKSREDMGRYVCRDWYIYWITHDTSFYNDEVAKRRLKCIRWRPHDRDIFSEMKEWRDT